MGSFEQQNDQAGYKVQDSNHYHHDDNNDNGGVLQVEPVENTSVDFCNGMTIPLMRKFFVYAIADGISHLIIFYKNFITPDFPWSPVIKPLYQPDIHQCVHPVVILNTCFKNSGDNQWPNTFAAIGLDKIREKLIASFQFQLIGGIGREVDFVAISAVGEMNPTPGFQESLQMGKCITCIYAF